MIKIEINTDQKRNIWDNTGKSAIFWDNANEPKKFLAAYIERFKDNKRKQV